jgi:hypothetical protein
MKMNYELLHDRIQNKSDSIAYVDSMYIMSEDAHWLIEKDSIMSRINSIDTLILKLIDIQQSQLKGVIDSSRIINDEIQAKEDTPKEIFKTMYDVLGHEEPVDPNLWDFYSTDIKNIAAMCPASGGPMVYVARNITEYTDDSIQYDDLLNCMLLGYYRQIQTEKETSMYKSFDFMLLPNPATGKVDVQFIDKLNMGTQILLCNVMGQIQEKWEVKEQQVVTLYLHKYLPGVYIIVAKDKIHNVKQKKLIIAK